MVNRLYKTNPSSISRSSFQTIGKDQGSVSVYRCYLTNIATIVITAIMIWRSYNRLFSIMRCHYTWKYGLSIKTGSWLWNLSAMKSRLSFPGNIDVLCTLNEKCADIHYVHGFVVFCIVVVMLSNLVDSFDILTHDDVVKWKHFPCHWPFVRGIHRAPVNSPHKSQWRGTLFSLIGTWINGWVNNCEAGDLRRHRAHYDVIIMHSRHGYFNGTRTVWQMAWPRVYEPREDVSIVSCRKGYQAKIRATGKRHTPISHLRNFARYHDKIRRLTLCQDLLAICPVRVCVLGI